jgi:hypothetical protein
MYNQNTIDEPPSSRQVNLENSIDIMFPNIVGWYLTDLDSYADNMIIFQTLYRFLDLFVHCSILVKSIKDGNEIIWISGNFQAD